MKKTGFIVMVWYQSKDGQQSYLFILGDYKQPFSCRACALEAWRRAQYGEEYRAKIVDLSPQAEDWI